MNLTTLFKLLQKRNSYSNSATMIMPLLGDDALCSSSVAFRPSPSAAALAVVLLLLLLMRSWYIYGIKIFAFFLFFN